MDAAQKASIDVIIVGEGALRSELEAKKYHPTTNIHFFGALDESEAYCTNAQLVLYYRHS